MHKLIGPAAGLHFELSLTEPGRDPRLWGDMVVRLGDEVVWSSGPPDAISPVRWTWIDLLEFLGRSMRRILLEESYPLHLTPIDPSKLRHDAEYRWQRHAAPQRIEAEDEAVFRFEEHHDVSRACRGIHLPSILLMREGAMMWVCTPAQRRLMRRKEIQGTLSELGDFLAQSLEGVDDERARDACSAWSRQGRVNVRDIILLRTGLAASLAETLQGAEPADRFWELEGAMGIDRDGELLAAARMTASAGVVDQQKILAVVRRVPPATVKELDALAKKAASDLPWVAGLEARTDERGANAREGYELARWLRRELSLSIDDRGDPAKLLRGWGVPVKEATLDTRDVDAVGCWGPRHGPLVLVNRNGRHASDPAGRRATLAHEIAHLLVDRKTALPLAEALGGDAPRRPEQRAGAFAAEFLAPQAAIDAAIASAASLRHAVDALVGKYKASRHVIGWQVTNGQSYERLSEVDRAFVATLVAE